MAVAYVFLRSSSSGYPRYKRQILRRRIWFRKEKARTSESTAIANGLDLGTWHNPSLVISRIVEFPVGISFEFEGDPPLLQRSYKGDALLRLDKPNESKVVAEIMDPKPSKDYPCLLYTSPSPRDATLSRMPSSA